MGLFVKYGTVSVTAITRIVEELASKSSFQLGHFFCIQLGGHLAGLEMVVSKPCWMYSELVNGLSMPACGRGDVTA